QRVDAEVADVVADRRLARQLASLAVDREPHDSSSLRIAAAAARGSAAAATAEMTATPWAPAAQQARAVPASTPPIAITGTSVARATRSISASPAAGWPGWLRPGKIVPSREKAA